LPRNIVCLRNISINTLHKGDDDDDDDNNNVGVVVVVVVVEEGYGGYRYVPYFFFV